MVKKEFLYDPDNVDEQQLEKRLVNLLIWFPKSFQKYPAQSWTTLVSPTESGIYFSASRSVIDKQLTMMIKERSQLLSIFLYRYFKSGYLTLYLQGWEQGVLTREELRYINGQIEDIGQVREPWRPRIGAYDKEKGFYKSCFLNYGHISDQHQKFDNFIRKNSSLFR